MECRYFNNSKITEASFINDEIKLSFEDGVSIIIWDAGQQCCEHRYMRTDDDIKDLIGKRLSAIKVREAPHEELEHGEVHEVAFLVIRADFDEVVFSTHNENNGYYSGFDLALKVVLE